MANEEHLSILDQGVKIWNRWRQENSSIYPDLREAKLNYKKLRGVDFDWADLQNAELLYTDLSEARLGGANLNYTNFSQATLNNANFSTATLEGADLTQANLTGAYLNAVDLSYAQISRADLGGAALREAYFHSTIINGTNLRGADLTRASMEATMLVNMDLSSITGLATISHRGPSSIGVDTLYRSEGKIPTRFLRGCGVPDNLLEYIPSLVGAVEPIQFYSCFISYSHNDEDFVQRLYSRMRDYHLRVWFALEDMKGGVKVHEQIDQAIRMYDKLVLVLSEDSLQSEWVMTELYKARQAELQHNRRKLFPIRLVKMDSIKAWKCFDADTGKDLAREVREYFIPDFTRWKDHDAFEREFAKLLASLKAVDAPPLPRTEIQRISRKRRTL